LKILSSFPLELTSNDPKENRLLPISNQGCCHGFQDQKEHDGEPLNPELSDEDKDHIRAIFSEEMVPRLTKLQARTGALGCEFADPRYKNWTLHFRSRGRDFDIIDFEYDEDADSIDLNL
jgi:hypothetical protein